MTRTPNHSVERTRASRSACLRFVHQWRLAPAAHADCWPSFARMHKFTAILSLGLIALAGCKSSREEPMFRPWCWENAEHAREYLSEYHHVLVARVDEHTWEDLGPHRYTPHHFKATVVRTYEGDWTVSERISFVHGVDSPAPAGATTNGPTGYLVFIFTNEHRTSEIGLDTGEWGHFREELAPGLEYLYPKR